MWIRLAYKVLVTTFIEAENTRNCVSEIISLIAWQFWCFWVIFFSLHWVRIADVFFIKIFFHTQKSKNFMAKTWDVENELVFDTFIKVKDTMESFLSNNFSMRVCLEEWWIRETTFLFYLYNMSFWKGNVYFMIHCERDSIFIPMTCCFPVWVVFAFEVKLIGILRNVFQIKVELKSKKVLRMV